MYNAANEAKDALVSKQNKTEKDRENFMKLKMDYENESLTDLVCNKNDLDRILESDGELIQRTDPVFLDPPRNKFLRAHFYAPRKSIFGSYFDTYWVNNLVIWSMTIVLFITLYFDVLKKLIDGAENLFSRWGRKKQ
jgi:hypothetical protein